jgi:hypothetical protein
MNKTNEQSASNGTTKPSFQAQNQGPSKVPPIATLPTAAANAAQHSAPDAKPETTPVVPEVVHQVTPKPVVQEPAAKPQLQKHS